jgi:hypothetical protein
LSRCSPAINGDSQANVLLLWNLPIKIRYWTQIFAAPHSRNKDIIFVLTRSAGVLLTPNWNNVWYNSGCVGANSPHWSVCCLLHS